MAHGQHILGQQVTRMRAHNRHAKNGVLAGHRQHLHKTACFAVGNGAVEVVNLVTRDFKSDVLLFGFLLVQANACHFRVNERRPRNHRIIGFKQFELAEQRVDGCIPGLVRGHMGQLVRPCHIASSINIGVDGLQVVIGFYRALGRHAQLLQSIAFKPCSPAHSANNLVKHNALFSTLMLDDQRFNAACQLAAQSLVVCQNLHTIGRQCITRQRRDFFVLTQHEACCHLNLRDL